MSGDRKWWLLNTVLPELEIELELGECFGDFEVYLAFENELKHWAGQRDKEEQEEYQRQEEKTRQ